MNGKGKKQMSTCPGQAVASPPKEKETSRNDEEYKLPMRAWLALALALITALATIIGAIFL